jgi:hypothetical protein
MSSGGAISWKSKLQTVVALSTTTSEYMAINHAGREGVWLFRLLQELNSNFIPISIGMSEQVPMKFDCTTQKHEDIMSAQLIHSDSTSAIALMNNNYTSKETKHIDKVHHWAREEVENKRLVFSFVRGRDNLADIFTKNLPRDAFLKNRMGLGMVSYKSFK